jgi:hypothetical protein
MDVVLCRIFHGDGSFVGRKRRISNPVGGVEVEESSLLIAE